MVYCSTFGSNRVSVYKSPITRTFYYLLLLTIAGAVFGCKKDIPTVSNSLAGTWELSMDVNGMTGQVTMHKPGNDTLAIFTTDGKYAYYDRHTLRASGSYTVKLDTNSVDHTVKNRIIFDGNDAGSHELFDINNNQLSIYLDPSEVIDGGGVGYRRIK